jgi:UDP-N-acetylmuramoyl-tripeptide--D-alanyl-D-alanine ligase
VPWAELAAAWRSRFARPLVAVTGSNGKTTVKEMLRSILGQCGPVLSTQGNLNNDIGVPLTLYGLDGDYHYAVIEMGANHPGEIDYLTRIAQPDVAVVTQCAPAHLEGFGSVEGVARAKGEIFAALPESGVAIVNADDAYASLWRQLAGARTALTFAIENPADVRAVDVIPQADAGSHFVLVTPSGEISVKLPAGSA